MSDGIKGKSNRCGACERAHAMVKGAKCGMHETATSPIVDRTIGERPGWHGAGWNGPVLYMLSGGSNPAIIRRLVHERHLRLKRDATPAQHRAVARAMLDDLNASLTSEITS